MFTVAHDHAQPLSTVTLTDQDSGTQATICPERGGMATGLRVHGHPIFFLDPESFNDLSRNVRGGNPVLFPSPGKLTDDTWARDGMTGKMKQHGFARILPWRVSQTQAGPTASVTLALDSDQTTAALYPFEFQARYTYSLLSDGLRIEQTFTNTGNKTMPFGAGFHPYFQVPQAHKAATTITTAATEAFDNTTKTLIPFDGFDLASKEVDHHLIDHGSAQSALHRPDLGLTIHVKCSPEFTHWVVWTLQGRDFVCLEPWTCPGDALNNGDRLFRLEPGATRTIWTEITAQLQG